MYSPYSRGTCRIYAGLCGRLDPHDGCTGVGWEATKFTPMNDPSQAVELPEGTITVRFFRSSGATQGLNPEQRFLMLYLMLRC